MAHPTTPIVCIVGRSNSGKTTFLERLVPAVRGYGLRVGVIKHHAHGEDHDQPGKDTWRLGRAGAEAVVLGAPEHLALFERTRPEWPLERLVELLGERVDLVLTEGYKRSRYPKIEVARPELGEPLCAPDELWGLVSDGEFDHFEGVPRFSPRDAAGVARLIVTRLGLDERPDDGLEPYLRRAAAEHGHLCPGQVLGVRLALLGCRLVGVDPDAPRKPLIAFVEIDRCGADAIQTITGCRLGKRTLKFLDYGKLAATFLNQQTGACYRVAALSSSRERAWLYVPDAPNKKAAQLRAYRVMPEHELFSYAPVSLELRDTDLPGSPRRRVQCAACGEDVSDSREVERDGRALCRPCADGGYYMRRR